MLTRMNMAHEIEAKALEARLTLTDVLKRAGVSRGTFYRARRAEGVLRPLTVARLDDAINQLKEGRQP